MGFVEQGQGRTHRSPEAFIAMLLIAAPPIAPESEYVKGSGRLRVSVMCFALLHTSAQSWIAGSDTSAL